MPSPCHLVSTLTRLRFTVLLTLHRTWRRILDVTGTSLDDTFTAGFRGEKTVGEVLVAPTALYPQHVLDAKDALPGEGILGMAHITGGGFTENIPRILPDGLGAVIDLGSWEMHPVFPWLQQVCLRVFFCLPAHLHACVHPCPCVIVRV